VPYNSTFIFIIKILKTKLKHIGVGILDETKQRNVRYSSNSNNAVCYYAHNGYKYPSGGYEGGGFSEG
jgi:hypothetical protein